jgi:5-methylthioadenosine/S-adenosylhomocysteine deaminase
VDMWDVPFVETLPYVQETFPADLYQKLLELPVTPADHWVTLFEQHHAKWHGRDDLVRVHLAPCGPQRCSPDLWRAVDALSSRHGVPVHSHCLETKVQAAEAQDKHGKSWIRYLADLGLLSDRLSLVHTIWIDENDIALMADHGVTSIHNPLSNLKTGAGIAPVRALLEAGISVALGSDGICTADGIDMIEVIKVANLMHTLRSDDYESWITPFELLRMATVGGARSGLMEDELGTLEPGKKADIILLDRDAWGFIPLADPINSLAYSVSSEVVRHSIINGRIVMRDRKVVSVNEDEIKLEVRESAERFLRDDVPRMRESASSYTPYMRALYRKAYDQAVPVLGMPRLHERSR